jgi:hypothetical protein
VGKVSSTSLIEFPVVNSERANEEIGHELHREVTNGLGIGGQMVPETFNVIFDRLVRPL